MIKMWQETIQRCFGTNIVNYAKFETYAIEEENN